MQISFAVLLFCFNICSNCFSTLSSVEKYMKSSTYSTRNSGGLPSMTVPWNRHGPFSKGYKPFKIVAALSNQCLADLFKPYRVRFRSQ